MCLKQQTIGARFFFFFFSPHLPSDPEGPQPVNVFLIGKDSDAGRDWGQEERGTTEDEMAGWHHTVE